jgi:hypothetical protein
MGFVCLTMLKATFFAMLQEMCGDGNEGLERGRLLLRVLRGSKPDEHKFGATETTCLQSAGRTLATGAGTSLTTSLASTPGLFGRDFITCSHRTGNLIIDDALGPLWMYIVIDSPLPSSLTTATSTLLTGLGLSVILSTPGSSSVRDSPVQFIFPLCILIFCFPFLSLFSTSWCKTTTADCGLQTVHFYSYYYCGLWTVPTVTSCIKDL